VSLGAMDQYSVDQKSITMRHTSFIYKYLLWFQFMYLEKVLKAEDSLLD